MTEPPGMADADAELIDPNATQAATSGPQATSDSNYDGVERRRPGRAESVSPELVGLLRHTPDQPDLFADTDHPLRAPTGIAVGVAISLLLWTGAYFALRALF